MKEHKEETRFKAFCWEKGLEYVELVSFSRTAKQVRFRRFKDYRDGRECLNHIDSYEYMSPDDWDSRPKSKAEARRVLVLKNISKCDGLRQQLRDAEAETEWVKKCCMEEEDKENPSPERTEQ